MEKKNNFTVNVEANLDPDELIPASKELLEKVIDIVDKYDISEEDNNELFHVFGEYVEKLKESVTARVMR